MSDMLILIENFLHNTSIPLTVASEVKSLPKENLREYDPTLPYQTGDVTSEHVAIDRDGFNVPNGFFIHHHNLTTGATVKVQDDDDAAFGSAALDETITIPPDPINYGTARLAQTYMTTFTAATQRYVRAHFADAANPAGYLRFGIMGLGRVVTLKGVDWGIIKTEEDNAPSFRSLEGQFYSRPRPKGRVFGVRVSLADLDDKQLMRRLGRIGVSRPTFISLSPFNNEEKATMTLYGVFRRLPVLSERVHHGIQHQPSVEYATTDYDFEFEEMI